MPKTDYRDLNLMDNFGEINPFHLLHVALRQLGPAISAADGFEVRVTENGLELIAHDVDGAPDAKTPHSQSVIASLSISPDQLDDLLLWLDFKEKVRKTLRPLEHFVLHGWK